MNTVIKRDGREVPFDSIKIEHAIEGASHDIQADIGRNAHLIAEEIESNINAVTTISVEEIQDIVERKLMEHGFYDIAKAYIRYRYEHELTRQKRNDKDLMDMVQGTNDYWNTENSNKNSRWVTTQRDYMAGIVSTDLARKYIFPKEVVEAHDAGIIHIHDMDYAAQNTLHNCCLINLDDMLQYGTVVNGVSIDKPHRLSTAMTIATQIIAAVASSQYGGCTITLTHLAPFVRMSFKRHMQKYLDWGFDFDESEKMAKNDTQKEIADAVQTLNYQLNSLTTTNGQAPFISIMMYLGETEEYKEELAALIEETLKQRIKGMKNRVGIYVTVAFPKLLYVLEEDNITPDSKYWYLTELAAKCTAKRMVPDYISERVMRNLKLSKGEIAGNGDCYPCMGQRKLQLM